MSNVEVKGGDLMSQIQKICDTAQIEVMESSREVAKSVSKETVKVLKASSPKNKGGYAQGWKANFDGDGYVVYNAKKPGLTHLLNNGHDIIAPNGANVGRTQGDNHIGRAEQEMNQRFVDEVIKDVNRRLGS